MENSKINIENHWKKALQVKKHFYFSAMLLKPHKFAKNMSQKFF